MKAENVKIITKKIGCGTWRVTLKKDFETIKEFQTNDSILVDEIDAVNDNLMLLVFDSKQEILDYILKVF